MSILLQWTEHSQRVNFLIQNTLEFGILHDFQKNWGVTPAPAVEESHPSYSPVPIK